MRCNKIILNIHHGFSSWQCSNKALPGSDKCRCHDPACIKEKEKKELDKYRDVQKLLDHFPLCYRPAIHYDKRLGNYQVIFNLKSTDEVMTLGMVVRGGLSIP